MRKGVCVCVVGEGVGAGRKIWNKPLVTSIVVEQGSFQTELRIVGNSNKLVYFLHIDFKNLQH